MRTSTRESTFYALLFGFLFCLLPSVGISLGFGPIKLYSYLNEPLDAEVEILEGEEGDSSQLVASLATPEDFKRVEMARPFFLSKLRFDISQKNKKTFIRVTSEDPIRSPYLEFLMVLNSPKSKLVRGYTLLLDPAPFASADKRNPVEELLPAATSKTPEKGQEGLKKSKVEESRHSKNLIERNPRLAYRQDEEKEGLEGLFLHSGKGSPETILSHETASVASEKSDSTEDENSLSALSTEDNLKASPSIMLEASNVRNATLLKNKLFLGSGFALLFFVGLSVFVFRRARSSLPLFALGEMNCKDSLAWFRYCRDKFQKFRMPIRKFQMPIRRPKSATEVKEKEQEEENNDLFDSEITIKLSLAQQYLEIHDQDSARELLEEIRVRGNKKEKEMATGIIEKMAIL